MCIGLTEGYVRNVTEEISRLWTCLNSARIFLWPRQFGNKQRWQIALQMIVTIDWQFHPQTTVDQKIWLSWFMQRISYVMDGIVSRMDYIATGDYVFYIFYTRAVCVIWMSVSRASQRLFHAPTIAKQSTGGTVL